MWPIARFRVSDSSMVPTLNPGDYVLVNRWAYLLGRPSPGDIVVVRHPTHTNTVLVKRVASVTEGGDVIVRGDNPDRSVDSRQFGPIPRGRIVGKAFTTAKP